MALDSTLIHVSDCQLPVILAYMCREKVVFSFSAHSELVKGRIDPKIHGNTYKNYKKIQNLDLSPKTGAVSL